MKQGAQKKVWLWDVRGRLTQQNKVPAKTLETQVLGPALPPPFSVALGKYPTPQASMSPRGEGFEHEFLEASSQLCHYRIDPGHLGSAICPTAPGFPKPGLNYLGGPQQTIPRDGMGGWESRELGR